MMRFFHNEARYLEPMLDAFQASRREPGDKSVGSEVNDATWEEKYIYLLWISHLLLTPFDLSTVGSFRGHDLALKSVGLDLPDEVPAIARKLIREAVLHLASPSKEREAAVKVLVRLSLRPDMQKLGLHSLLVQWSAAQLQVLSSAADIPSPYEPLGFLSFLAGIVTSADASVMFPHLLPIFKSINSFSSNPESKVVSSAVSRKVVIKIFRSITLSALQLEALPKRSDPINVSEYVLEAVIDYLLTSLADKDTPVRYAASKAISMITIKLEPELVAEVTEAVTGSLGENVLWEEPQGGAQVGRKGKRTRDLSAVNPLRWHGLILTLSQLLFQRSPLPSQLPPILNSLIVALNFEQRGSSGTSIGANVRDAANFGIWSLARRFSTKELMAVEVTSMETPSTLTTFHVAKPAESVIQVLAAELVAAATLDPSGNIRRGSSAALQELIGRHPDTVPEGIGVVQVVDYRAVALRQRAFESVAVDTSKLDPFYWDTLLEQSLGWRGVSAADAPSRRYAARTIGLLSSLQKWIGWQTASLSVWACLEQVRRQDNERRHGLLLALSAVVEASWGLENDMTTAPLIRETLSNTMLSYFKAVSPLKDRDLTLSTLRPELTAEAITRLISSLATTRKRELIDSIPDKIEQRCLALINLSLSRREDIVTSSASTAARNLLSIMARESQIRTVESWVQNLNTPSSSSTSKLGLLSALGAVFPLITTASHSSSEPNLTQSTIWTALLSSVDPNQNPSITTRVAALHSIEACIPHTLTLPVAALSALKYSLQDYTTDERGDIGSLTRLAAIDAVQTSLSHNKIPSTNDKTELLRSVACLAAEKLDKVRLRAWTCLRAAWAAHSGSALTLSDRFMDVGEVSAREYYGQILQLLSVDWLRLAVLRGYITSAGTGSESVLRASRAALAGYLEQLDKKPLVVFAHNFLELFKEAHAHERLAVPALDALAYILQTNTLEGLRQDEFE